jgi:hypothetical protein
MATTKAKAKTPTKPASNGKANGKQQAAAPEKKANRYLRAARVIIAEGEGVGLAELAVKAELNEASAKYALDAFRGVTQALRESKLMPAKPAPAKAPAAPKKAQAKEPVPA